MGKAKKSDLEEEMHSKTPSKSKSEFVFSDSDDDADANADLSLKIVEKSKSRASSFARRGRGDGVAEVESHVIGKGDDIVTTELVALDSVKKKSKREKRIKKAKRIEAEAQTVNAVPEGQNPESIEGLEVFKSSEQDGVDNSNNPVLQQLLRAPRYFTISDSSFGTCYNCGEEGHTAANCKIARRKKPCFICGGFEHGAKECQKGKDCFICNKSGHRARDCPKKFKKCAQGSDLCLKCGSAGHAMSSCNNDYSLDDLKEIQCYVCKGFGHLCCANYFETVPTEVSCYKCGQLGHTGLACRGSHGERVGEATPSSCFKCGEEGHFARECSNSYKPYRGTNGEMVGQDTPSSCYKCGEEGHFARECLTSYKGQVNKRSHDQSTPKRKASKDKAYKGYKSAPQENGKAHKKKKLNFDDENSRSSSKWKPWTGWTTDDPADFPRGKSVSNAGWDSYSTPNGKGHNYKISGSGRYASASRSPKRFNSPYSRTPNPQSSRNYIQHEYSASRFNYPNSAEPRRRNNDRW